jgi:hypothetical protein
LYLSNIPKDDFLVSFGKGNKRLTVDKEGNLDVTGITADSIITRDSKGDILFSAAANTVQIAGWSVTANEIVSTGGNFTTSLNSATGEIYTNNIQANGGKIGSWDLGDFVDDSWNGYTGSLYSDNEVIENNQKIKYRTFLRGAASST